MLNIEALTGWVHGSTLLLSTGIVYLLLLSLILGWLWLAWKVIIHMLSSTYQAYAKVSQCAMQCAYLNKQVDDLYNTLRRMEVRHSDLDAAIAAKEEQLELVEEKIQRRTAN